MKPATASKSLDRFERLGSKTLIAIRHRSQDLLVMALLGVLFLALWRIKNPTVVELAEIGDKLIKVVTLGLAVLIWIHHSYQHWEDNLPKRLFVTFNDALGPRYCAANAPLTGEGDIRVFAQQIGRQMNKGDLPLVPHPVIRKQVERIDGEPCKCYYVLLRLSDKPNTRDVYQFWDLSTVTPDWESLPMAQPPAWVTEFGSVGAPDAPHTTKA